MLDVKNGERKHRKVKEGTMIHVIIRVRNAEKYIESCLSTLKAQSEEWKGILIIDAPDDETHKIAKRYILDSNLPVEIYFNQKRKGLGYNLWYGIDLIKNPHPEDIIVIVDGDDWIEREAFNIVVSAYKKHPECLLTYGSYINENKGRTTKVSERRIKMPIRKTKWAASHLKTFKYKLWQHFPPDYLQHDGMWAEAASDRGLMYALVELAGVEHCVHIKRPIYHWRPTKHKTEMKLQKKWEEIFRNKEPLEKVDGIFECLEKDKVIIVEDPAHPVLTKDEEKPYVIGVDIGNGQDRTVYHTLTKDLEEKGGASVAEHEDPSGSMLEGSSEGLSDSATPLSEEEKPDVETELIRKVPEIVENIEDKNEEPVEEMKDEDKDS